MEVSMNAQAGGLTILKAVSFSRALITKAGASMDFEAVALGFRNCAEGPTTER